MFVKLLQNIDTLKYHLYPDDVLTPDEISKYNDLLSNLVTLKSKAQTSKHDYCPYDNFTHDFKGGRFRVRPYCTFRQTKRLAYLHKALRNPLL